MRLLILGLDGLSWNMLDRFDVDATFISRIRNHGVDGDLHSVDPPATFPAWTSFATGKDPSSHGVTNMIEQGSDYNITPCRPNREDAAIFDFLPNSTFVNLQGSYGREPASQNSHLVSGKLAPERSDAVPGPLRELDTYNSYHVFKDDKFIGSAKQEHPEEYVAHLSEIITSRYEFASEAFNETDPDVGFVLFAAIDWLSHFLSNAKSEEQARDWYSRLIELTDSYCEELAQNAENVVIVSDHGFEHKRRYIHLNHWLEETGYLVEKTADESSLSRKAVDFGLMLTRRSGSLNRVLRSGYDLISGTSYGQNIVEAAKLTVDYPESLAWDIRDGCIYINDNDFEKPQISETDEVRDQIISEIEAINSDSERPIFRDVVTSADAYAAPDENTPDIIARPAPNYVITEARGPSGEMISKCDKFDHRYRGVFAADGQLFEEKRTIEGLYLEDVLPTLLHALNQPVAPDFDGTVSKDVLRTNETPSVLSMDDVPRPRLSGTENADDAVEERLADLGYIE